MADFTFDDSKNFEENCTAFLAEMESVDAEMAEILKENWPSLLMIVKHGERDPKARMEFNTSVAEALDALTEPPEEGDQS